LCRWGGDEFVLVQNGSADELATRGREITAQISGTFPIKLNGFEHEVSVGAEFGWAAYQEGESAEQLFARADKMLYDTKTPRLQLEASPKPLSAVDPATLLPKIDHLEDKIASLEGSQEQWFLACFAIRSAARVNNHYGFPATDTVLPFLRDEIRKSTFGKDLFRGRGSSLLALVQYAGDAGTLEVEMRRICNIGLEKHLTQKRRASILPIAVGAKLFPALKQDSLQQVNAFIDQQRAGDQVPLLPPATPLRGMDRVLTQQKN
jgi:GGDEF domain-containing protein